MAERPEDLNLPITVVQRIIKEALPDGVIVSKEARQTICRASSVFVLYLTSCAVTHANKAKRKTLAVNDILAAIGDMEFDSFVQPLTEILKYRKENPTTQGNKKQNSKSASNKKDEAGEEGEEEVDEEEETEAEVEDGEGEEAAGEEEENEEEGENENENANERKIKKRKTDNENENEVVDENQEDENESDEDSSNSENEID